ncbi:MAG: HNH endonuclease family protein [Stenotrophobium sp.]
MKIALKSIKVSDLIEGYEDKSEEGVRGYAGKLNIRPAYQREFIYKEKQRNEVIHTVRKDFPLNTMYWAVAGNGFELMDGQQRTVSICQYVNDDYAVEIDGAPKFFSNLTADKQQQILDYALSVYVCEGNEGEKLDWFKIINIAGEKLTDQELRNAIYTGSWLSDAKRWFSKSGAPAAAIGSKLVNGSPIRQEYLETAIDWIANGSIQQYMAEHQHDQNANALWTYFQNVMNWANLTFTTHRKEMKGVAWGPLYNVFGTKQLDTSKLEADVARLMRDEDVTKKSGVYDYVLSGNERALSIRAFTDNQKREAYERQKGICPVCKKHFVIDKMEADHITPWSKGGKTIPENCQMLCDADNRKKSGK